MRTIFQVNNTWLVSVTPSTIPAPLLLALNSSLPTELLLSLILVTQLQFPLWEKVSENTSNYQQQTLKTYPFILVIIKITLLILIDSGVFWACETYDRTFFLRFFDFYTLLTFSTKRFIVVAWLGPKYAPGPHKKVITINIWKLFTWKPLHRSVEPNKILLEFL